MLGVIGKRLPKEVIVMADKSKETAKDVKDRENRQPPVRSSDNSGRRGKK